MKKIGIFLGIITLLFPCYVQAEEIVEEGEPLEEVAPNQVELEKCIDGDSAKFRYSDGRVITYRFLGIDAPEMDHPQLGEEPYAKEASNYTCDKLTKAAKIILEFDEAAEETDAYDRGLAWVFVDDVLLQEQLVSYGYAKTGYLYGDYKYNSLLKEKEEQAKAEKIGIWEEKEKATQEEAQENSETIEKEKNFWSFLDQLVEAITASINHFVDSILQMIEDML